MTRKKKRKNGYKQITSLLALTSTWSTHGQGRRQRQRQARDMEYGTGHREWMSVSSMALGGGATGEEEVPPMHGNGFLD